MSVETKNLRNVALVGHNGTGKTNLVEQMLYYAGVLDKPETVESGKTTSDFTEEEIARKISVHASLSSFKWEDRQINILDTPGTADFIGETGIDRYWNYGREGEMEELFRLHLRLADELDLPVVVHSRDADSETAGILRDHCPSRKGIIHCFSSDTAAARTFLDLGFMISFAGNVTYKANEELRKAAAYVPLDRILLETDSPYLSPVPLRGRPNTPASIVHTYTLVAGLRGLAPQQLDEIVRDNYLSILQGTV